MATRIVAAVDIEPGQIDLQPVAYGDRGCERLVALVAVDVADLATVAIRRLPIRRQRAEAEETGLDRRQRRRAVSEASTGAGTSLPLPYYRLFNERYSMLCISVNPECSPTLVARLSNYHILMPDSEHPFDRAITIDGLGDGRFVARTTAHYANMVGPFGGVTAAVLMQCALEHPARLGDPVAFTVNFASAIGDGPYEIAARPERTNRSTQHWSIVASQSGEVVATATAVFAKRRPTWSRTEAEPPLSVVPFDRLAPTASAGRPPWVSRYEVRSMAGGMPSDWDGSEAANSTSRLWVRDNPPRPLDYASLTALCDTFMPRIFIRRRMTVPIATVTMTTYFHADAQMLIAQGDRPLLGVACALNFRNGYFDQSAQLWDDQQRLLASTHQLVYYRE